MKKDLPPAAPPLPSAPPIDLESLDAGQRMELADALYDAAMQAAGGARPFTPDQAAELDRRLGLLHAGGSKIATWASVRHRWAGRP